MTYSDALAALVVILWSIAAAALWLDRRRNGRQAHEIAVLRQMVRQRDALLEMYRHDKV